MAYMLWPAPLVHTRRHPALEIPSFAALEATASVSVLYAMTITIRNPERLISLSALGLKWPGSKADILYPENSGYRYRTDSEVGHDRGTEEDEAS